MNDDILNYEDLITLSSNGKTSTIEILKVGVIHDRGLKITDAMLDEVIKNFYAGVYGSDIQVNFSHAREGEAAGWIKGLFKNNGILFAEVDWTPLGIEKITSQQFRYTSSELSLSYTEPKNGSKVKNVLIGVALTNIPAVKGMNPVTLSEELPCSNNVILFLNETIMKDAKAKCDELMAKKSITQAEFDEAIEACEKAKMAEADLSEMKKKLGAKVAKMSEEDPEKKVKLEDKKTADETVKLSEFKKMQEDLAEANRKAALLEEKVERADLRETISDKLILSETVKVGFLDEMLDKLVGFEMGLTPEQRTEFHEILSKVQHVDLSTVGSTNAVKTTEEQKADQALEEANQRAKELSAKTGKPLAECLSEEYRKLQEAML